MRFINAEGSKVQVIEASDIDSIVPVELSAAEMAEKSEWLGADLTGHHVILKNGWRGDLLARRGAARAGWCGDLLMVRNTHLMMERETLEALTGA